MVEADTMLVVAISAASASEVVNSFIVWCGSLYVGQEKVGVGLNEWTEQSEEETVYRDRDRERSGLYGGVEGCFDGGQEVEVGGVRSQNQFVLSMGGVVRKLGDGVGEGRGRKRVCGMRSRREGRRG